MIRVTRSEAPIRIAAQIGASAVKVTLPQAPIRIAAAPTAGPSGPRGETGEQGPSGDASLTAVVLSEAVSALRAVTFSGRLCTPQSAYEYAGIALQAGNGGDRVSVRRLGLLADASFAFTAGEAVFIGAHGVITKTAPTGYVRRIGTAVSAREISLQPQQIIGVL